ncbi:MAG: hypothetical protein LBN00_11860 [Oscillospiraceae bacterium]|jgi:hypothetical protein|nr:hypothetical protein [Oscillospiraceae bacterium]
MEIYVAIPVGSAPALPPHLIPARIIYRVRGARLYRARGAKSAQGGVAVVNTSEYTGGVPSAYLVSELAGEVEAANYGGVVLDTGGARLGASPLQIAFANELADAIAPRTVYVPEILGAQVPNACVLVQTALSGGSLERHLSGALTRYGERVALECDRVRMDFALPSPSGFGAELDAAQFAALAVGQRAYYSNSLCCNYFTYPDEISAPHIVLFDDAQTIKRKFALAETLGIGQAFLFYPHIADIIDSL